MLGRASQMYGGRSGPFEGERGTQCGSVTDGTLHFDRSPERVNAVGEADEAGTASEIGPSRAVVVNRKFQHISGNYDGDLHERGMGVLGRIRQRFRHDVIGGDLHRRRRPRLDTDRKVDRDSRPPGQRLEGAREPAVGQDGRVDAARDLLQFLKRLRKPVNQLGQLLLKLDKAGRDHPLRRALRKQQGDEPLLYAVVQVALEDPDPGDEPAGDVVSGMDLIQRELGGQVISEIED